MFFLGLSVFYWLPNSNRPYLKLMVSVSASVSANISRVRSRFGLIFISWMKGSNLAYTPLFTFLAICRLLFL